MPKPPRPTGSKQGSSYVLLGGLGVAVVAVLLYVLTLNSINQAKTDIATAKNETAQANAQAEQLGAYGDFAKVKTERVEAVKQLAGTRMDWERLVRELAHVLPNGVWIQNASAADSAANAGTGTTAPTSAATGTGTPAADGPSLTLEGCATDQRTVADTLVRLRELQGATDVKLDHSAAPEPGSATAGSTAPSTSGSGGGDCGKTDGRDNYEFEAIVTFEPVSPESAKSGKVPARLGGGQ